MEVEELREGTVDGRRELVYRVEPPMRNIRGERSLFVVERKEERAEGISV